MSEILSIEKLREMAQPIIDIPDFEGTGTIKVRVQKPQLLKMAEKGTIPNHLMNIAVSMMTGNKKGKAKEPTEEEKLKRVTEMIELYCVACLVEPSYDEFNSIMTDDQKFSIFNWGTGEVHSLDSFRSNGENGTNNSDGQEVPKKTE